MRGIARVFCLLLGGSTVLASGVLYGREAVGAAGRLPTPRPGRVRIVGHGLVDGKGPFLGLGVSYFTALWRCKNDRTRLESDLAFLQKQGFTYYRMLSMVGWNPGWSGLEIAPVAFTTRSGKRVDAWPDYWQQLRELIDLAYDRYGMRTQVTLFADAQLMPDKSVRIEHMRRLLAEVLPGRDQKIMLLEVANEAWQNGFPGETGQADLREFAQYLGERTQIPVAITSNHEDSFKDLYAGSAADIATWHFSRDRRTDEGWKPVYDCWEYGDLPDLPPASSNEPIGPGASVASETETIRLVMAAAFAYVAKLPMYVFHSQAGVMGKTRFEETPGIDRFRPLMALLPNDLANWKRNDGKEKDAPFTVYAGVKPNAYWPEVSPGTDGCVRNTGSRKGNRFLCIPIGIRPGGLVIEAREPVRFRVCDPLTGKTLQSLTMQANERRTLPQGPGALLLVGQTLTIQP